MKKTALILILLAVIPALGNEAVPPDSDASQLKTTIFLVRHAEKVEGPGDPDLNRIGQQRATDLARLLKSAKIRACYSSQFKRTKMTAAPTAKAADIAVQTHSAGDELALVKKVLQEHAGSRVLIAAHSNTVPTLLRHLGYENQLVIEEEDFDNLFVVHVGPGSSEVLHLHYGQPDAK